MTKCTPLPDMSQTLSEKFLEETALSDMQSAECLSRHNQLVDSIKEKQNTLK